MLFLLCYASLHPPSDPLHEVHMTPVHRYYIMYIARTFRGTQELKDVRVEISEEDAKNPDRFEKHSGFKQIRIFRRSEIVHEGLTYVNEEELYRG